MSDRELTDVLDQILVVVPQDHDLQETLQRIQRSVSFAAPEMKRFWWREAAMELEGAIPFPAQEGWHQKAFDIFVDKEHE